MDEFDAFYREMHGERWSTLRDALLEGGRHAARVNPYCPAPGLPEGASLLSDLPGCYVAGDFEPPERGAGGLKPYYLMDAASVAAARALDVRPGHRVLDLCAAPGGKALILAEGIGDTGSLTANERSGARRRRLERVLSDYLPDTLLARIRVTGHDAAKWGMHEPEAYDRILVDAPCSSEAHVLRSPAELARWSPARSRKLAVRQHAMLASAIDALKPGGRAVYSTCSVSVLENDRVIDRLLKKRGDLVHVIPASETGTTGAALGQPSRHGRWILPDEGGWGPIFIVVIEKRYS